MVRVQKAALWFGLLNVVIGVAGFLGAAVTGNQDGFININPGNLLGSSRSTGSTQRSMWASGSLASSLASVSVSPGSGWG